MYHGNEDFNILSQVELLYSGKGAYAHLYQDGEDFTTTNVDEKPCDPSSESNEKEMKLIYA